MVFVTSKSNRNKIALALNECREELRLWLVKWTGCSVQSGLDKSGKLRDDGWPCGTCACFLLATLGAVEDGFHNNPVDRNNEAWRAILQLRGDEVKVKPKSKIKKVIKS
jgi:hypothetical protein